MMRPNKSEPKINDMATVETNPGSEESQSAEQSTSDDSFACARLESQPLSSALSTLQLNESLPLTIEPSYFPTLQGPTEILDTVFQYCK